LIRALTVPRQSLPKRSARQGQKLKSRAKGERDPIVLKTAALSASVDAGRSSRKIPFSPNFQTYFLSFEIGQKCQFWH
jgi:hypothetical protein